MLPPKQIGTHMVAKIPDTITIFSPADIESNDAAGIPGYLGTPSDSFQRYNPKTVKIEHL